MTFSPAFLRLPTVWSFLPSASRRSLPTLLPTASLTLPLSSWALLSILSPSTWRTSVSVAQRSARPAAQYPARVTVNRRRSRPGRAASRRDSTPSGTDARPGMTSGAHPGGADDQLVRPRARGEQVEPARPVGDDVVALAPTGVDERQHRPAHGRPVLAPHLPAHARDPAACARSSLGRGPWAVGAVRVGLGGVAWASSGRRVAARRLRIRSTSPSSSASTTKTTATMSPRLMARAQSPLAGELAEEDGADRGDADRRADALAGLEHARRRCPPSRRGHLARGRASGSGAMTSPLPRPATSSGSAIAQPDVAAGSGRRTMSQRQQPDGHHDAARRRPAACRTGRRSGRRPPRTAPTRARTASAPGPPRAGCSAGPAAGTA